MVDLTEPRPRAGPLTETDEFEWPIVGVWDLLVKEPKGVASSLDRVAADRSCVRELETAPLSDVMSLLRYVFEYKLEKEERRHKRIMSAGAIHPVYPIILPKLGSNEQPILYQAESDTFVELSISDASKLADSEQDVQAILPDAHGHHILLVGDKGLLDTRYANAESLLWRDAGVALQMLALTASACQMGFCPLGILGIDSLCGVLGDQERIFPLGMFVVGVPDSR